MIATSSALAKLPPSVRDFEIFRFVRCECRSTRAAAREFHLSQTRVRQVIARVLEFYIESVPPATGDEEIDAGLVVAQQLAREQLDALYERTVRAFNESEREDIHGNVLPGKATFLVAAARIALCSAKVPFHLPPAFRDDQTPEEADDRTQQPGANDRATTDMQAEMAALAGVEARAAALRAAMGLSDGENDAPSESPPIADCSPEVVSRGESAAAEVVADDASTSAARDYPTRDEIQAEARRGFAHPAQLTESHPPIAPQASEAALVPVGADVPTRPLSRKERRARERRLRRQLARR